MCVKNFNEVWILSGILGLGRCLLYREIMNADDGVDSLHAAIVINKEH